MLVQLEPWLSRSDQFETSSWLNLRTTIGLHKNKNTIVDFKLDTLLYGLNKSIRTTVLFQTTAWSPASPRVLTSQRGDQPLQPVTIWLRLILVPAYRLTTSYAWEAGTQHGLHTDFLSSIRLTTSYAWEAWIRPWSYDHTNKVRPLTLITGWHQR